MSLTKDMIMNIQNQVESFSDNDLLIYNSTYRELNNHHPNSYYRYMIDYSSEEILRRGLDEEDYQSMGCTTPNAV